MAYIISSGESSDGIILENDSMTVLDGGTANDTTVNSGGRIFVNSKGMVNNTTVNTRGSLTILSGGTANHTIINNNGILTVEHGGTARDVVVHNGGSAKFEYATVDSVTVNAGANVYLKAGTVTNIIENGGCVGYISLDSGSFSYLPNTFSGLILNTTATVHSGTTATETTINAGYLMVFEGGVANSTTVNNISGSYYHGLDMFGGTANDTTVNSRGYMLVHSTAMANNTTVNAGGSMLVSSGGMANNTTINSGGRLEVGGTANNTTVNNGRMDVSSGGRVTGKMVFERGAVISTYEGAILDFDLTRTEAGAGALVNDLSIIQGAPLYTLTVDGTQANGVYSLAGGADGFNSTISVVNAVGDELGTLTVGETVLIGETDYTLNLTDGTLSVEIAPAVEVMVYAGDFNGDGKDMLAVQIDSKVTIYMNGEPWGLGLTADPGWDYICTGDFSGDGLDDFLRVNEEGYVVGEMSNGNGTFSPQVLNLKNTGWEILGVGDFNGNGTDDILIANPTGASETVGLLGYWESGVTWTLINGYSAEWECVSTGNFNGDGKCDMLWRNSFEGEDGLTYNAYCTWITDPPTGETDWRMVSVANPDEWDFLCSGDFDGNGSHDIAMINDVGVVGIWGISDGYLNSWSILSAVNPAEWQFSGVADFNGDGTDDIAWGNVDSGLVGCWQIENKGLASWQALATIS